uniref:(northern house mosquito) hypothetical protein n=1 Tax=Culex pipiens TaxID=7175 RepID=A0A8D7ZYE2_CULPI
MAIPYVFSSFLHTVVSSDRPVSPILVCLRLNFGSPQHLQNSQPRRLPIRDVNPRAVSVNTLHTQDTVSSSRTSQRITKEIITLHDSLINSSHSFALKFINENLFQFRSTNNNTAINYFQEGCGFCWINKWFKERSNNNTRAHNNANSHPRTNEERRKTRPIR